MMADSKLSQKSHRENSFKRLVTRLVLLAFCNQNLAFATQSIIELDIQGSQTHQRLHTILPSSKIADVSHVEIDIEQKQAAVYLKEKQEEALDELQKHLSQGGDIPVTTKPVILQKHNIINLPWELEPEKLTLFILSHTAWLSPLDEDGYKLEFKGGLLGGGQGQSTGGGGSNGGGGCPGGGYVECDSKGNCNLIVNVCSSSNSHQSSNNNDTGRSYGKSSNNTSGGNNKSDGSFQESKNSSGLPCVIYKPAHVSPSDEKALRKECGQVAISIATEKGLFKGVPYLKKNWEDHYLSPLTEIVLWECDHSKGKSQLEIENSIREKFKAFLKGQSIWFYDYQRNLALPRVINAVPANLAVVAYRTIKEMDAKHTALVNSLSQKFMRQERWFSDIQKPFQQNGKESVYKGFNYNVNVPLSPLELEACQGKTVCVLSSLKTDTPGICRVQVVAFKGKVVMGCMQSDALPKDQSGYLFTALHFDFKDYDSVWVRPLMVGGKQDATISAWTYSTWITDIPISKQEASQIKVAVNSKNTAGFVFPDSPLVYPYFSKDHTTAESFLPAKSYSLDTGNRLFQEFLTNMAGDEGSSSFQTALAVTPYIKNHVLQHAPFKDKDFPDLKTRSQSLLAMAVEALYGDSTQDFLDKSKIFYTKAIPFQELSKAYQTHHEILGHMLPTSWQEMIKKQGKTALTPHSDSLAKWSILHDVATEMGRRCGIPVPSVFSTLDVIQSITNAGFEFFALEPEERKVFCQQFDGFGKSLCGWLDYNFEPLFDGVLLLTTKGQGKPIPVKWSQLKPKIQPKLIPTQPFKLNNRGGVEVTGWREIPKAALDKIPAEWGQGTIQNGNCVKWAPDNGKNYVRFHKANPKADYDAQKVDYVKIVKNKQCLDAQGNPIMESLNAPKPASTSEAHIPYDQWIKWKSWDKP